MENNIVFDSYETEEFSNWTAQWKSDNSAKVNVIDTLDLNEPFRYLTRRTDRNQYSTNDIRYHITIPEYPESSPNGILHIIDVKGRSREEVLKMHEDIQFGKRKLNNRSVKSDLLNDAPVHLIKFVCSGVKICPNLYPQLRSFVDYTKVDDKWFSLLESTRKEPVVDPDLRQEDSEKFRLTEGLFLTLQKAFYETQPCTPYGRCSGKPALRSAINLLSQAPEYHIGCTKYRSNDGIRHHWNRFKASYVFDPQYLQTLFVSHPVNRVRYCNTIDKVKAMRSSCMEIHTQDLRSFETLPCVVNLVYVVPDDLETFPWAFLWSNGIHKHPPPPPSKTPNELFQQVNNLMKAHNILTLTRGEFLRSPQMAQFLREHNAEFIGNVHPSFNNDDLWRYHIRVLRLMQYPQGTNFVGVINEYHQQKLRHNLYIQEIIDDEDGDQLVCCFTRQQALEFMRLKFIQVDMTFKRIYGKITEIVFGYFNDSGQKSFTVARIYVNNDTTEIYKKAFSMLFRCLFETTGQLIQFQHIHGTGFVGVLADMCGKQAHGLGAYLHSLDPRHTWQEHISHVLIYCLVHFERNIRVFQSHPLYFDIKAIPKLESRAEIQLLFNRLKTDPDKKVRDFARRYNCQLILGGLNKHYSLMTQELFTTVQHHTNSLESIHRKTNQMGIHQSWLGALKSAQEIDSREINAVTTWFTTGVKHSWVNKSPSKRLLNAIKKRERHIQKLDLTAKRAPTIYISSGSESEDVEVGTPSRQLVADQVRSSLQPVGSRSIARSSSSRRGRSSSQLVAHQSTPRTSSLSRGRSALQLVALQSSATSASPKRGRSFSLQLSDDEGEQRSLSRRRLVEDQLLTGESEDDMRRDQLEQQQLVINRMQVELDKQRSQLK